MGGCAVLSVVPCVGVPPFPCGAVPPSPCAGAGGRWARPGVVRAVSGLGWGGVSWRAGASGVVCLVPRCGSVPWNSRGADWMQGVGRCWSLRCGASLLCGAHPGARCCVLFPDAVAPPVYFFPVLVVLLWLLARVLCCPPPCSCGRVPVTLGRSSPPCCGPSLCTFPFGCAGGGWWRGLLGADGPCLGVDGRKPPA